MWVWTHTADAHFRYSGPMETPERSVRLNRLEEVVKSSIDHTTTKPVYGEPVSVGDKTILPVAQIRYGFGGGSGHKANDEKAGRRWTRCQPGGCSGGDASADGIHPTSNRVVVAA